MQHAATGDPKRTRFARVPTGAETCAWCMLWASRGFIYRSEASAQLTRSHFKCDCQIVPSWSKKPRIRGYDVSKYEDMYKETIKSLEEDESLIDDPRVITERMRTLFADKLTDGHTPKP